MLHNVSAPQIMQISKHSLLASEFATYCGPNILAQGQQQVASATLLSKISIIKQLSRCYLSILQGSHLSNDGL